MRLVVTWCSYYDISLEWKTTNSIEASEITVGYTVICPCLFGFFNKYVLYSFDKRHTQTKLQIKDLKADKIEVLGLGTPTQRAKISVPSISVNGEMVKILNIPIGSLGSVFDQSMNMAAHVSKAVKSANYHLRNIGRIRKYLTAESSKSAVISLVTSRFDYCNGLLCGIPEELICKLQRVQNIAARVITLTKKHDHITPVLKELHWLPVRKRIEFKILLLAYKCLHGTAPSYLSEILKEYVPPRTLQLPPVKICYGDPRIVRRLGWTNDLGFTGILTGIFLD